MEKLEVDKFGNNSPESQTANEELGEMTVQLHLLKPIWIPVILSLEESLCRYLL